MRHSESIADFMMMLKRQWKLILIIMGVYTIAIYIYILSQDNWYHADFRVVYEPPQSESKMMSEVLAGVSGEENIENAMEMIQSNEVIDKFLLSTVNTEFKYRTQAKEKKDNSLSTTIKILKGRITPKRINSRAFHVTCYGQKDGEALFLARSLADIFIKHNLEVRQKSKRNHLNRLEGRLLTIKNFLEKANIELELLQTKDEKEKQLAKKNEEKVDTKNEIKDIKDTLAQIDRFFNAQNEILDKDEERLSGIYRKAWPELVEVEARKVTLEMIIAVKEKKTLEDIKNLLPTDRVWRDKKVQFLDKTAELEELNDKYSNITRDINLEEEELKKLDALVKIEQAKIPPPEFVNPLIASPEKEPVEKDKKPKDPTEGKGSETEPPKKEIDSYYFMLMQIDSGTMGNNFTRKLVNKKINAYEALANTINSDRHKYESMLEIEKSPYSIMNLWSFEEKATFAERKPLPLLLFIGLFLAVGMSALLDYMQGVPASESIIEKVSGLEALEVIPDMLKAAAHQGREVSAAELPILCHLGFLPGISDRFRIIKAKLLMKLNNPKKMSLIITSCGPQEGKSTCAGNIAVAFAEMGYKTLLCSCNLRRPTLEKSLQISDSQGMSEILAGEVAWQELVHATEIFNLYLIPSGSIPRDSSKLIFTKEFRSFFEQAKKVYDIVILDTPPILMVVDAMILSRMVDGIVLVYAPERSPVDGLIRVKKQVADVGIPILGIIVNWFESKRSEAGLINRLKGYGYGNRGYGHGYRGGYGNGYGYGQGGPAPAPKQENAPEKG